MTDLDAAIRAKLDKYDRSMLDTGSQWGVEEMQAAILVVLDIHKRNGPDCCTECWESGPGYEGEPVPYPCPTVLAIAEKLEIET